MLSRAIYVVANDKISFFFYGSIRFHYTCIYIICIYHIFFIHSSVDGHLSCFHVTECKFVCPMNSEAKQTETLKLGAGPSKENRWLMPPKPQIPKAFQQRICKGQVREGRPRDVTSSCTILGLPHGEVSQGLTV